MTHLDTKGNVDPMTLGNLLTSMEEILSIDPLAMIQKTKVDSLLAPGYLRLKEDPEETMEMSTFHRDISSLNGEILKNSKGPIHRGTLIINHDNLATSGFRYEESRGIHEIRWFSEKMEDLKSSENEFVPALMIQRYRTAIKRIIDSSLDEALAYLRTHGVDIIILVGYTPGFNDGDPCVHEGSCHFGVMNYLTENYYDGNSEIEALLSDIDSRYDSEGLHEGIKTMKNPAYTPEGVQEMKEILGRHSPFNNEQIQYSEDVVAIMDEIVVPLIEQRFTTDYAVVINTDPSRETILHADYDCGY